MNRCSHNAASFSEGISGMANAIRAFCDIYRNTWENYTGGTTGVFSRERHRKLVDELVVYVRILLEKFATEKEQYISRILAETLLTVVTKECVSVDELLALCSYITDKGE
jgi:hypothetical protein